MTKGISKLAVYAIIKNNKTAEGHCWDRARATREHLEHVPEMGMQNTQKIRREVKRVRVPPTVTAH